MNWLKDLFIVEDARLGGRKQRKQVRNNIAFVDGKNVHLGVTEDGWNLSYQRFAVYLREKYGVREIRYWFGCPMKEQ